MAELSIVKVDELPDPPSPDTIYLVKHTSEDLFDICTVDSVGSVVRYASLPRVPSSYIVYADTAPALPNARPFWLDTTTGGLYVQYNDGQDDVWLQTPIGHDDIVFTNKAQAFTAPQRAPLLVANDGIFNLSLRNNFKCMPTATVVLTFTQPADGVGGSVVINNASGQIFGAHADTDITLADLERLSTAGRYRLDFLCDGVKTLCSVAGRF